MKVKAKYKSIFKPEKLSKKQIKKMKKLLEKASPHSHFGI